MVSRESDEHAARIAAAAARWPSLGESELAEHVAALSGDAAETHEVHVEDLALALACAMHDERALRELDTLLGSVVPKALAAVRGTARQIDDVQQELRTRLVVPEPGERAKLLEYRGRGPLGAWLRVAALRLAYTDLRSESAASARAALEEDALFGLLDASDDPEIAHLRRTYAAELKAAFGEAVGALSVEERAVLRASVVESLTVDAIGALYQVHRATAARWVANAKAALTRALRAALAARLGRRPAECDSVVALVESRIDLSLERLLAP